MPAAAVIPAPIAYIKVVAVKTLVVEVLLVKNGRLVGGTICHRHNSDPLDVVRRAIFGAVTLSKLECFKQA